MKVYEVACSYHGRDYSDLTVVLPQLEIGPWVVIPHDSDANDIGFEETGSLKRRYPQAGERVLKSHR